MARRLCAAWLGAAIILLLIAAPTIYSDGSRALADVFLLTEDLPVLLAASLLAAILLLLSGPRAAVGARLGAWVGAGTSGSKASRTALLMAGAVLVVGGLGAALAIAAFPLSMDEFMAGFDAEIFRRGQVLAPVASFWRPFVPALQPMFILPTPGSQYWASAYLPMNAALRALAGSAAAANLVNPLLSALSVVAVFGVGRQLWPHKPALAVAAAALLATSSQFLVMAMTAYAMPAHLALNLVWLWLFLRGGRAGHAGAALVTFVACGLHQLVFHPLFAAPFVAQLWLERRWRSASFYTAVYALVGLFWVFYWTLALGSLGLSEPPAVAGSAGGFIAETTSLVGAFRLADASLMAKNLIRLMTWQNPLTVPLAILAFVPAVRAKGMVRAMTIGLPLMAAAMWILLAYQGYGWGYRYLHGALGSLCLLAAFGWTRLTDTLPVGGRSAANGSFVAVAAASVLCLVPLRLWQAAQWVRPYASASAAIAHARSDIVLVDETGIWFGRHLVRNDPYLANRPIVLDLAVLDQDRLAALCPHYSVSVFDRAAAARFGLRLYADRSPDWRTRLRQMGCREEPF